MARWMVVALLIFFTGCQHGIIIPKRLPTGQGTYGNNEIDRGTNSSHRFIPESLLRSTDLFSQAEACAVAHNTAEGIGESCGVTQGLLRGGQLVSAGTAVLAAGLSGRVQGDGPKRRWDMTALASTALLGALTGFDAWLNCGERTFVERGLAAQRLARLNNAGRLASCGTQLTEYEKQEKEARDALATVTAHGAPADVGVAEAVKKLDEPAASSDDLRKAAQALRTDIAPAGLVPGMVAALPQINQDRDAAAKEYEELVPLKAVMCRDIERESTGKDRLLRASDYMDAAHKELVECLTPRFTAFGTTPVSGVATP